MIKPQIINNQIPLICAHNNSLKVLIQYIEKTKLESINDIYIPNAKPLIYFFDDSVFCYNLGDTRILKITEHNLIQISKDHIYDKQN